jgi:hypothetical protein
MLLLKQSVICEVKLEKLFVNRQRQPLTIKASKVKIIISSRTFNFVRTKSKTTKLLMHARLFLSLVLHECEIPFRKGFLMSFLIKCSFNFILILYHLIKKHFTETRPILIVDQFLLEMLVDLL